MSRRGTQILRETPRTPAEVRSQYVIPCGLHAKEVICVHLRFICVYP
jgi:hypothetical protein